jgi:hypothetical protein
MRRSVTARRGKVRRSGAGGDQCGQSLQTWRSLKLADQTDHLVDRRLRQCNSGDPAKFSFDFGVRQRVIG